MKKLIWLLFVLPAPASADVICQHFATSSQCQNTVTGETWQRREMGTTTIYQQVAPPAPPPPQMKYLDRLLTPSQRELFDE